MRFVGIDLAWKSNHPSGIAVLDEDGRVVDEEWSGDDQEIAAVIERHDAGGAVLGFDAPLVLRRGDPAPRACERELQRRYAARHAGPYSSSFDRLGGSRAMDVVGLLTRRYITIADDPMGGKGHWAIEVFPHPTIIELGGFERIIKYKRGPIADRRVGLHKLYAFIVALSDGDPPLRLDEQGKLISLYRRLDALRGAELKQFEDLADAHVCAITALWWWRHGPRGVDVFGDPETGEILVARKVLEESP